MFAIVFSPAAWAADWVVNNTDTGYDPIAAGGDIVYTVRVSNNDNTAAAPATTLTLSIPATTTFVGASGMSCSGTGPVTCTVPALAAAGNAGDNATVLVTIRTTVQGTVTLGASVPITGDTDPANNTANQDTTVNAGADIALSLSGPASAQSGSMVSYTFTALNNGPDASGSQTLSFPIPTGLTGVAPPAGCSLAASTYSCSIAGLAVGASTNLVFTGQVSVGSPSTLTPSGSIAATGTPADPITANNTATFNTTVTAGSDVRIGKSRSPAGTLLVGQAVTFTLTPTYTGDSPNSLTISDTIPANYTIGAVAVSQNGWTCGVAGQTVTCTKPAGSVAGANVSLGNVIIPVTAASAGSGIVNSASIGAAGPADPNLANNTANDGGATIQAPTVDLRANKSGPSPALVVVGNPYSYAISTTNIGNAAFFGTLVMTDALPTGLTVNSYTLNGWSCAPAAPVAGPATITCQRVYTSVSTLAAGATTPAVTLNTTATGTGSIVNSMTVSSPDANIADTNPANDTVTYTVTGSISGDSADVRTLKTVSPATVAAGDVLTYTLEIVNAGPQPSASVNLTDNFTSLINNAVGAAGAGYIGHTVTANAATGIACSDASSGSTSRQLTCAIGTLPVCTAGSNCPVIQVQVRPGGNGGSRTNSAAAISSVTADPDLTNNTGTVTSTVDPRADVTVSKNANPASVPAGQNLTYVVTATNIANGLSAADAVTITDTLPNDLTFVSATPSAGSCATTPAANSTTGAGNNQVICNLGTINNGSQQTVTIIVRPNTSTRGTTITNNVGVSTTTTETNAGNNSASASTPVSNPSLDLLINKVDSVDPLAVGDNTVYTVSVTNQGPSAAENVVITYILPPTRLTFQSNTVPAGGSCPTVPAVASTGGTLICLIPYLAAGQSRSFTVTMQGVAKGVDPNAVSVSSAELAAGFDTNAGNNSVTETTTVRTKADMQVVSKIPSVTPVNLRDNFNFVVKVRNNTGAGLAEADNVVVSDNLPAGMELTGAPTVTIVAGTTTSTTCTGGAGSTSFTCNLGTVSSGGEFDITVPVQVITTTSSPQTFNNTASVATSSLDTVPANNSNSGSVVTNASSIAGRVFRDFNNDGLVTASDTGIAGIAMTLTGTSFDGAPITRTVTTDASGNYNFANIPQGTYSVTEGAVAETWLNDGTDTAGSSGGTVGADTVTAIALNPNTTATGYNFAEVPQARIGIAKQVSAGPTNNADGTFNVTFSLVVENFSLEALNNVTVTDQLAGVAPLFGTYNAGVLGNGEYKIASLPSGTCAGTQAGFTGTGGAITAAITPTLAAGASCTISFALQVRPTAPLPPILPSGGRYENQAVVNGTGALSGQTPTDLSDNGANPDPDNDNQANEAGENDPTPVAPTFNAAIGIAKQIVGNVSVQPDGSLLVPIRLVTTNIGNEPLNNVSITDPLATAAGGQFGGYVAGGAAATLAAGQYTVQTAPAFSGACTNGAVVPAFSGDSGNLALATITTMATTASCTVDFTYRFLPATLTTYTNQAQASGTGAYTGTPVNDLSDDGANPDPNGNGNAGEAGENDPTPIPVPRIGVAKAAGGVVNHGDGTYSVPFTLTVRNYGQTPLSNVQITDAIAGALPQFGTYTASAVPAAGQYTIASGPTVGAQTNGAALIAVAAGVYTGSGAGNALLVPASSSLPNFGVSASSAQIAFTVRFFPTTQGPFNNSAVAAGSPPGGGTVTDNSVAGGNPDPNGNGDPADDTSPTVINLSSQAIGVAKRVSGIVQTGAKRYRIPYSLIIENVSTTVTATNVQITDSLATTFPTAQTIAIAVAPAVSACTGTVLSPNAAFTGIGQNNLLAGNQNLQPGERCTIAFTTEVDFGANLLPAVVQNNQAVATTAQTPGGTVIATDLSDDGTAPDADGDHNANESGENDPTPVSFAAGNLSSVSGKVYLDANHNRSNDDPLVSSRVQGFIVEILNAAGTIVGTATTDASGNYTVGGLFPSTSGDASTYYSVRFREPVSGAIYGIPQSADPTPARNGTISNGVITALQLAPGTTTLEQNLPLDPSGVIYDSVTRAPVTGAQVTLTFGGAPVPVACLVGGANTQTTGATGQYQFLLINPAPLGCPGNGTYTLQVVQPGGYLAPASAIIPPTAGPYTPTSGGVDAIQAQSGPPTGSQPTTYYFGFVLTLGTSSQVVNNHIPLDPILGGAIALSKITPLVNVARGDLVPYTITATNTLAANLPNIDVVDRIPAGFRYRNGSATLNGVPSEPTISGRQMTWRNLGFTPNERKTFKLILTVGAGVGEGEYPNLAWAMNNVAGAQVSNTATATVRVIPDPTFDCSDIIGKVFDDKNANGWQDDGEPGIPNVRVVTARGLLVTTDAEGRFHVACAAIPQQDHGSNFVMKLDERTLPTGYRVTTENPRDVRVTRGKMVKLNFGATVHRVVRLELSGGAFVGNSVELAPDWATQVAALPEKLKERPSVLRIAYRSSQGEAADLGRRRLDALAERIRGLWKERRKDDEQLYPLVIETELEGVK
ncbi:MAG: SdrD B-like domain-containing protein [Rhodocyclaceae bacterium]|nr:SdrD B-like domain-containing protein [Rhodocyclaceae bacterium]